MAAETGGLHSSTSSENRGRGGGGGDVLPHPRGAGVLSPYPRGSLVQVRGSRPRITSIVSQLITCFE